MRKTLIQTLLAAFCAILATAPLEGGGVMLINMRNAMLSGGKRTPTAKDYVQDGLMAMWDGIENAGWGVHDPSATTWKDYVRDGLVAMWDGIENAGWGTHDPNATTWVDLSRRAFDFDVPSTLSWTDDALVFPPNGDKNTNRLYTNHSFTQNKTIEVVAKFNTNNSSILRVYDSNTIVFHWKFSLFWDGQNRGGGSLSEGIRHYAAVCIDGADGYRIYQDRRDVVRNTNVLSPVGETAFTVGYYPTTTYAFNGDICAIRFHNRALTAEEIARNYAIDKARFKLT